MIQMIILYNLSAMRTVHLPIKSSKSNNKISIATFFFEASPYGMPANISILSEQLFGFTMHHSGHRESTYVMVNRNNTLPNTYMELAEYLGSSCRLLRHSKIYALVHSLNLNSLLLRVHPLRSEEGCRVCDSCRYTKCG